MKTFSFVLGRLPRLALWGDESGLLLLWGDFDGGYLRLWGDEKGYD